MKSYLSSRVNLWRWMVNLLCFLHLYKGWKLFPPSIFIQLEELMWQIHFDLCHLSHEKDAVLFTWCMVIAWLLHGVCMMIAWWLQKLQGLKVVDRYVHGEPPNYLMNLLTPSKAAELYSNWCWKFQELNSCVNPSSTGCSTEWNYELSTELWEHNAPWYTRV